MAAAPFYERHILNAPYTEPTLLHHLDETGQPTDQPPVRSCRESKLISPVKQSRKGKRKKHGDQQELGLQSANGLIDDEQTDLTIDQKHWLYYFGAMRIANHQNPTLGLKGGCQENA